MLIKKEKAYLRRLAQPIKPVVQIGKFGLTEGTFQSLDEALTARELVKVQVLKNSDQERTMVAQTLAEKMKAEVVQEIGRQIVLYRANPKKPRIDLTEA